MSIKIIDKNKKASHDFFLHDKFEAGIDLRGTEVKSIRLGKAKIKEAFVTIDGHQEAWLNNAFIASYDHGNRFNHQETRKRKLLLHKKEIIKIQHLVASKGYTIVPTILYFKRGLIKIEIALAKGKKLFDKRQTEKAKDIDKKLKQGKFDL